MRKNLTIHQDLFPGASLDECGKISPSTRIRSLDKPSHNKLIKISLIVLGINYVEKQTRHHSYAFTSHTWHSLPAVSVDENLILSGEQVVNQILEGEGIGWLKLNRLKKLMEDESYRNFVVSKLNRTLDRKISPDDHIDDVVSRPGDSLGCW